jgi:hypothetical protein
MSRVLEGIFVIGCSLVGFGLSAPSGSRMHDSVERSAQLIANIWPRVLGGISTLAPDPRAHIQLLIMKHVL